MIHTGHCASNRHGRNSCQRDDTVKRQLDGRGTEAGSGRSDGACFGGGGGNDKSRDRSGVGGAGNRDISPEEWHDAARWHSEINVPVDLESGGAMGSAAPEASDMMNKIGRRC